MSAAAAWCASVRVLLWPGMPACECCCRLVCRRASAAAALCAQRASAAGTLDILGHELKSASGHEIQVTLGHELKVVLGYELKV